MNGGVRGGGQPCNFKETTQCENSLFWRDTPRDRQTKMGAESERDGVSERERERERDIQFSFQMYKSWNGSTLTFRILSFLSVSHLWLQSSDAIS